MQKYPLTEIFRSLQGEGYWTGSTAVFVRFAGCNLACEWCDTDQTIREQITRPDLIERIAHLLPPGTSWAHRHVVFTGGEPALQLDQSLIRACQARGWFTQIETNGTISLPPGLNWVTVSPKEQACDQWVVTHGQELKIIWTGHPWFEAYRGACHFRHYFLQPKSLEDPRQSGLLAYIQEHPTWRLSVQMHKWIGIP